MNIALVVLNWNGRDLLEKFLPTLVKNSPEANIYMVDNASMDTSVAYVEKFFPEITIIQHSKNVGFANGYNLALSKINADVYALINSDVEVTPNWLKPIIEFYNTNSKASIVQPKILDFKYRSYFEYAGAGGGFIDKYGYAYCRGRIFEHIESDKNQYESAPIFWASGACLFIKAKDYKNLNGFDDDFFAHYEEIDLCWRAQNQNLSVDYIAESTVYHVGGGTLSKQSPFKTYLNFRNSLFTLVKNLPKKKLFPIIFTRMILDGIAGIRFLLSGELLHFWSILKAHFSFYSHFSSMYKKREKQQKNNYYQTKSIVWQSFIKKQNTYKS
ncbi:glycosyltransferase family 2 protein [Wenyingzhuangia sp. IMCC45467]